MGAVVALTAADGHRLAAYRADPDGAPRGLVVIGQEIFGVNGHIRDVCDRYAADGWVAVAPALFDRIERDAALGYGPDEIQRALGLKRRSDLDAALRDVAAARAVEPGLPAALVGFCWGGLIAWAAAARLSVFAATVGYYGGGTAALAGERPRCPVMLHFGDRDSAIPLSDVETVRRAHPDVPVHLYAAGHGFNCEQREGYHPEAAALAFARTQDFLRRHLGAAGSAPA